MILRSYDGNTRPFELLEIDHIQEGWQPLGGLYHSDKYGGYYQAMVKYEE